MRRNVCHAVFTVVAGLLVSGASYATDLSASGAAYEEGTYVSNEVMNLRAEVDALRTQLDSTMATSYDDGKKAAPKAEGAPSGGGGDRCNSCCGNCCNPCCCGGTCGCFEPYCHASGLWAEAEVTFFRYHRADGVRVGTHDPGDDAEFDFEVSPRITVGYVRTDGLGFRVRYWEYDHTANAVENNGSHLEVDTWTLDFEVFDTFCLNRNWSLELSGGIRYNDFSELMLDADEDECRHNAFDGFGGIIGVQLRRCVGCNSAIFARARGAILMSDKDIMNLNVAKDPGSGEDQDVELLDVTVGMIELALGAEYVQHMGCGVTLFARATVEWQNWYNFSSSFDNTDNTTEAFSGPSDVGFGGFAFSVGVAR